MRCRACPSRNPTRPAVFAGCTFRAARGQLAEELELRVQRSSQLLEQGAEALGLGDVLAAVRCWQDACQRHGRTQETDRFASRLGGALRKRLQSWHEEGRIDGLMAARSQVAALAAHDQTLADCARLIELCGRAAAQLAAANYTSLRQTLLRLKAAQSDVAWVNAALAALARVAEGQELLMASPLGLFASDAGPSGRRTAAAADLNETLAARPAHQAVPGSVGALRLDRPLLMLVDGGGSSLLLRRTLVRIGRAGSSAEADVPIPADLESHHADIVRRGEDYFLTAYGPALVNHRRVEHTLLRDGDRIVLGENAKLSFHKPSSKSESAVLRLSHRCRLAQDVGDVVLFRDTCLIGAGATCHVRTREDGGQLVLFERDQALCVRQTGGNGHLSAPVCAVHDGQTLDFGGLRVTIKPYAAIGPKGSV